MSSRVQALKKGIARLLCTQIGDTWENLPKRSGGMLPSKEDYLKDAHQIVSFLASQGLGWEEAEDKSRGFTSVVFVPLEIK